MIFLLIALVVALAVAVLAAGSRRAGTRAGALTALLGAPTGFVIGAGRLRLVHDWVPPTPYGRRGLRAAATPTWRVT